MTEKDFQKKEFSPTKTLFPSFSWNGRPGRYSGHKLSTKKKENIDDFEKEATERKRVT